jgi:amino acid adenylation domain-containing protein
VSERSIAVSSPADLSAVKRALLEQRLRRPAAGPVVRPRPPDVEHPPLTFAQERLWFMEQFAPGSAAYTIPLLVRLRGKLDRDALTGALSALLARHEALRSRFPAGADGQPAVHIDPPGPVELPMSTVDDAEAARRLLTEALARPFDLATGPLVRPLLVRLGHDDRAANDRAASDHVLLLAMHHIVTDGWSLDVVLNDLIADYEAARLGRPVPRAEPPTRYGDYAYWQRRERPADGSEADLGYWRAQLAGLEPLALPTDRPRPARQSFAGASLRFELDGRLRDDLTRLAQAHGATLYMALLTGWQAVLARHSGQVDFAVGSPVAGRPFPELEGLVGMFVNMLTMRARLDGNPTFADALARTRETCLDAYAHQSVPFEELVNALKVPRDVSRSPLFQVLFGLQNYQVFRGRESGGLSVEPFPMPLPASRFDLELYCFESGDALWGGVTYNPDLFAPETVQRITDHFAALLRAVVAEPDRPLSTVDLLTAGERRQVLAAPVAVHVPAGTTLVDLVEAQVRRTPGAVAVVCGPHRLTYAQLDGAAERLRRRIRAAAIGPGAVVAVCAERSPELVVALLAVLKAGAAYLPLDPDYPAERLAFMLRDSAAAAVLTQRALAGRLPGSPAPVLLLDGPDAGSDGDGAADGSVAPGAGARPAAGDLAYVIYTSGSTGRPKGVANTHRGIVNRLDWMQRTFRLGADDAVLQKTPASFDVSVWEFFWPLLAGARLVLARPGGHRDPAYLAELIAAESVTTVHFVPSMLAAFLDQDPAVPLRRIICSGEELPVDLARRCLAAFGAEETALWNLYGPTEAAVDVSAWRCTADNLAGLARVPIGSAIQNVSLYVLDRHLRPAPIGVPGELFIAGTGLARGYLHRPGLTAERFRPDPYGPPGGRMYATGDLARWRPDGTIDFLGRLDDQVKVRGMRIELGEIEVALREQPGVRDAAVTVRVDSPGDQRIVAYVVSEAGAGTGPDTAAVRSALRARLPDYMVPSAIVALPALPLSPNGKLDRRALPPPVSSRPDTDLVAPGDATETALVAIWTQLLGVETVGVADDFFDLGGHSLLATRMVARIRSVYGAGVSVLDVFQHPTIRELADLIRTPAGERGPHRLLHRLTPPAPPAGRVMSLVCVPYGGGTAVVFQPLADAMPPGCELYAVAVPGHDIGLDQQALPFDELVDACVAEILATVDGPLVLYGHCGIGGALTVELARRLEAAGRTLEAVYVAAIFPFARPAGRVAALLGALVKRNRLRGNRGWENWLRSLGVELADLDPAEAAHFIVTMRAESDIAENYFTDLFNQPVRPLRAPFVAVVGERDPATEFHAERFREWHHLSPSTALVVLEEAGHFFIRYRADELADIVTRVHRTDELLADPDGGWAVQARSVRPAAAPAPETSAPETSAPETSAAAVQPSLRRFLVVAAGQLVSIVGSALTEFALPLWVYLTTDSLTMFAVFAVLGLVPGLLAAPVAGAVVDRHDRRRVMLLGDLAAGGSQAVLLVLALTDRLAVWHVFGLIVTLSVALSFQRLAYASAVPQLVPKRYLGHANGVAQLAVGVGQFLVPLLAAGLLATIGLAGILLIDVVSYLFAVIVLLLVRFPDALPWRRRESLLVEIMQGMRMSLRKGGFGALLAYHAGLNLFLTPLLLLVAPLVLSFGTLSGVARVSMCAASGAIAGGLVMSIWGGPREHRVRASLWCVLLLAAFSAVAGLRPVEAVVAIGAFGITFGLALVNGIYVTVVQIKVPQRFHGRVFALNTVLAWSTIPIAWGLVVPFVAPAFEGLLRPGGPLADTVGALIGVGPGRGIAFMFILFAAAMALYTLAALRLPALARFDERVPDAPPDDLIGSTARRRN